MSKPRILEHPLYALLRAGEIPEFNRRVGQGERCDLTSADLSRLDLRGLHADGLELCDAYFRTADLRGIDFRMANLEGASIAGANISGCYFPKELPAAELLLSLQHGIRMRYFSGD
jgi:uncharacterized protein YjbI with pentapeptide repeats